MSCSWSETQELFGLQANYPDIWWILLLTCCCLDHISHDTHAPRLAFKLLSDNCAWHKSLLTGGKHKTGIYCGRLGCASISPLGSGRWRDLLMPWPSRCLFMVPQPSNMLKLSKKFPSDRCCYLLQRVRRCYSALATLALVPEQHACGSVSTKQSLFPSTCNVLI